MTDPPASPLTELDYDVRASRQARGASTQTALLDAAEALFADKGVEATTVAEIAERAGSSVGSFYHHFGDKETIQFALFDRFVNQSEAATLAAIAPERWEGATVGEILRAYIRLILRSHHVRPSFKKAGLALADHHPELGDSYDDVRMTLDRGLRDLLLARRGQIGHPEPEKAATFVIDQINTMLRARHQEKPLATRFGAYGDAAFLAEATRSVCRYLETEPPSDG
ncbi:MAG: TetR/AcrR family transcriptional regulator [Actinomycetota bacterium]